MINSTLTHPTEIKNWLDKMNIKNYTISESGMVNVSDSVDISNKNLTSIPIQFGLIDGSFDCSHNQLTSFHNFPRVITKFLSCYANKFTHLKDMPEVGEGIDVSYNELVSLEGIQKTIKGYLYIQGNKLTSLKGGPDKIKGAFIASKNQLVTLEAGPTQVKGSYYVQENKLVSLKGIPLKLETVDCSENLLENLAFIPGTFSNIDYSKNPLSQLVRKSGVLDMNQFLPIIKGRTMSFSNEFKDFFLTDVFNNHAPLRIDNFADSFRIHLPSQFDLTYFNMVLEKEQLDNTILMPLETFKKMKI
jgi:hypothetical protein